MKWHIWNREPLESEVRALNEEDAIGVTSTPFAQAFHRSVQSISLDEIKREINTQLISSWNAMGDQIWREQCVADYLKVDGQSFWHYYKFKGYFAVREWMYEIEFLNRWKEKEEHLVWYTAHSVVAQLTWPPHITVIHTSKGKLKKWPKAFSTFMQYAFQCFLRSMKFKTIEGQKLIINKSIPQNIWNIQKEQVEWGNAYLNQIICHPNWNGLVISDSDIPSMKGNDFIPAFPPSKSAIGESIFFSELIRPWRIIGALKTSNRLKKVIEKMLSECASPDHFLILTFLKQQISSSSLYVLKYNAWKRVLKSFPPSSITLIDENSPLVRCVVDAARDAQVPVLAIQHGSIHEQHPTYMYSDQDRNRPVFPTKTLVWGEHWKSVLIQKGNYPADTLEVTGQQRTDLIFQLIGQREKLRIRYVQSPNVPIVLFATQPQQDETMRRRAALDVFHALKFLPHAQGIFKLHPAEKDDLEYYHQLAQEVGCQNYVLTFKDDLYVLLAVADVVITAFSTVGTEAVYFKKPIVIWDPLNQDLLGLIQLNLAFPVRNGEEMHQVIQSIIEGKSRKEDSGYNAFITHYTLALDGRTAERILAVIESQSK